MSAGNFRSATHRKTLTDIEVPVLQTWIARYRHRHQLPQGFGLADVRAARNTRPIRVESFEVTEHCPLEPAPLLAELAMAQQGQPFLKWWQYFDAYERELATLAAESREGRRTQPIRLLEIGVWRGGSLGLWRDYLGPQAIIFGVDIDPVSATWGVTEGEIRIGSQTDSDFMLGVIDEMGGVDIVIDDGSHISSDVLSTLRNLWPQVNDGGIYLIEDLHTSYWPAWGGGLRRPDSSIEALKSLVDVLHQPYFQTSANPRDIGIDRNSLSSIIFYDSVAALRKKSMPPPVPFRGGVK